MFYMIDSQWFNRIIFPAITETLKRLLQSILQAFLKKQVGVFCIYEFLYGCTTVL